MKEKYKQGFISYLHSIIDIKKYDDIVNHSELYFGQSNSVFRNIESNYYSLINDFYIDNLSEEHKQILNSKNTIDDEVLLIVKDTFKDVLKKGNSEYVMYNPPIPEHRVLNGSLVLEFVYGKNSQKLSNDEYIDLVKKQRDFIKKINESLIKELSETLNIPVYIFVEKRL